MNFLSGNNSKAPLIVKLGGSALEDPDARVELWRALRELHASLPGGLVLVHGGGGAVDRHLSRLGLTTERIDGLRVTPEEQIDHVVAVLAGQVNKALVGALNRCAGGSPAVGVCLGDGGMTEVETHPMGDLGRVGRITGGSGRLIAALLKAGFLPVVASIGIDEGGKALNVNADDAATGLAKIIGASALVLLTGVAGIKDEHGALIGRIDGAGIERLIEAGVIAGGMIPKARGAAAAANQSGVPVVIAAWNEPRLLKALAAGSGVGTRVVPSIAPAADAARAHQTTEATP